jgi:hemerythrin-like domain-containing protein
MMIDPVAHWRAEHVNFSRLLDIFEKQVHAFHEGGEPNYELMTDILLYLRHFPYLHHHPREEAAFELIAKRDPKLRLTLELLRQQHRAIATVGDELLRTLDEITSGTLTVRAGVEAAAAMYLVYYRHHIETEEEEVLPRAAKLLVAEDWRDIDAAAPHGPDPLFGAKSDAGYRELRRHIALEAESG